MEVIRRLLLVLSIGLFTGCDNNPHVPPLHKTRPDGSPWIVTYRVLPEDPRSLDPQFAYDEFSNAIASHIYDTFLTYNPLKADYELIPMIGMEIPEAEMNPDGTGSVTCRIKPGIFFHDDPCFPGGKGREVTSHDFVYSFKRMADPKVECPIASTMSDYLSGFAEAYAAAQETGKFDYDAPFAPVTVVDSHTFRIHIRKPFPQLKYWLAMPFTAPVAREAVQYYDGSWHDGAVRPLFRSHPVGTGAFRLADWSRGQLIRFERVENYHTIRFPESGWPASMNAQLAPLAGSQLPAVDEVQYLIMRESIPAWILFSQGWTDTSGVGKDVFDSVINPQLDLTPEYAARGIQLVKTLELSTFWLTFNMKDPILGSNAKLRQALCTVYDAHAYNEIFRNNILHLTNQLIPPLMFGYDPEFRNPWRETNVERARELIAEAGFPGGIDPKTGKPLEIVLDSTAESAIERQSAEFEARQFEQLGIRIRIQENLFSQMIEKQMKGTFQLLLSGWGADYPDPENFFALFYGPNVVPTGHNSSSYQNPVFDKLFEQMANMSDSPERQSIINQMNELLLVKDCVIGPVFNMVRFELRQPWAPRVVTNATVAKAGGMRYAVIDPKLREKLQAEWNRKNYIPLVGAAVILAAVVGWGVRRRRNANV